MLRGLILDFGFLRLGCPFGTEMQSCWFEWNNLTLRTPYCFGQASEQGRGARVSLLFSEVRTDCFQA